MLRKILLIIVLIFSFFIKTDIFAFSVPVQNVFSDIKNDYKYIKELQTFYDKGMIVPDSYGKFNPYDLLNRDDFVGIAMEVSCKKCIQPEVDLYFTSKYINPPFFDVNKTNKNFYCIADAKENNFVKGYDNNYKCNDATYKSGEKPFCVNNNIVLEEALAIVLRMSGILLNEKAEEIRQDIIAGNITENLSSDVSPKNIDGTVYSFYPDFKKALEYEVVEYDTSGNKIVYKLVEKVDNKLRPKKNITKEEFLKLAYVALKANSCQEKIEDSLALKMKIYDRSCNENQKNCDLSDLDDVENIYDFDTEVGGVCEKGIKEPSGYIWRFYNKNTGEEIKKYGKYIDNYKFLYAGDWRVYLRVIDNCLNTAEVYNDITIKDLLQDKKLDDLKVSIEAEPIIGKAKLKVDLEGIANGGVGGYSYERNFGDGEKGFGKIIDHIFKEPGIYVVVLKVTDKDGNIGEANVKIKVLEEKFDSFLALKMIIFDKICTEDKENCNLSKLDDFENIYDFTSEIGGICEKGIKEPDGYVWRFNNKNTGEEIKKYGRYIDNYKFLSSGDWRVYLKVTDNCGKSAEVYNDISIKDGLLDKKLDDLKVGINANPIEGKAKLKVDLEGIASGGAGGYSYEWDFGDGEKGFGKTIIHIFKEPGIYVVVLKVKDKDGNIGEATVRIKVRGEEESKDSDGDGILDYEDICPLVKGLKENDGCPIFDIKCDINSENPCENGYECEKNNFGKYVCLPNIIPNSCDYSGGNLIFGKVLCNSCPCTNTLDFISAIRKCDKLFPAITSPDSKSIYSQGKVYEIKK